MRGDKARGDDGMTPQIKKDTSKGANQNQDDYIMTTIESQVWNRLSHKPISRNALRLRTGYSDRQIRKAVQNLRNNGYPVISNSDKNGYWIARSEDEIYMLVNELRSRASEMLKTARSLENVRL